MFNSIPTVLPTVNNTPVSNLSSPRNSKQHRIPQKDEQLFPQEIWNMIIKANIQRGNPHDSARRLVMLHGVSKSFAATVQQFSRSISEKYCEIGFEETTKAIPFIANKKYDSNEDTAKAFDTLDKFIQKCPNVHVDLAQIVSKEHRQFVLNAIAKSTVLRRLNLEVNADSIDDSEGENATYIVDLLHAMCANKSAGLAVKLDLRGCDLEMADLETLSDELKTNKAITSFRYGGVDMNGGMGDDGMAILAEGLKENTSVKELWLASNSMSDPGAVALAEVLTVNPHITLVDLTCNEEIGSEGTRALANMLASNTTLKHLDLCNNRGGNASVSDFVEALKKNQSLEFLGLVDNEIDDAGADFLTEALNMRAINYALKSIAFSNEDVSKDAKERLRLTCEQRSIEHDL